jgi:arylformamidase
MSRAKGPLVWLDMDQTELDAAYTQRVYAPNVEQVLRRHASGSEDVRARLGAPRRLAYGPAPIEQLDLYATSAPAAMPRVLAATRLASTYRATPRADIWRP